MTCPTGSSYLWSTGANTASIKQKASGSISATYQDNFTCPRKTDTVSITAFTVPAVPTITLSGNVFTCNLDNVSYQWFNGANPISGATAKTYTATATGNYSVAVSNPGLALCSKKSAETPYTLSSAIHTGSSKNLIQIYPNPVKDMMMIQSDGIYQYQILNTIGQVVNQGRILTGENTILLTNLNLKSGLYLINLTNNSKSLNTSFIKE